MAVTLVFVPEAFTAIGHPDTEFNVRHGFRPAGDFDAVLAFSKGKLVGAFRAGQLEGGLLWAGGTWVAKEYRGAGLAMRMWQRMLRETKPTRVNVTTITRGGKRLVAALKRKYPRITWAHDNEAT